MSLFSGFLLAAWLSLAINGLIDILGHTRMGDTPVRSFVTHSIFTAPVWGGLVGVASVLIPYSILKIDPNSALTFLALTTGVIVAYSHLFLDALTEAGVYFGRRRIAIAHFRYDNPLVNLASAMIGAALLIASFL
jgi:hypothetical protein